MSQIISAKAYQRIDSQGYWIETVQVAPTITTLEDGSFEVVYDAITPDLIDTDIVPSPEHRWDGTQWKEPEIIVPDHPGFVVARQIDDNGFYLTDVTIEPTLINNVWVHPGVDDPDYVIGDIPGGFYKPRYVKGKWVEGATKQEIKLSQPPNWTQFITDFSATDLDEMIAQPNNMANCLRLNRALTMSILDGQMICECWNRCLDGLATPPNDDQRKTLIKLVEANNLPVTIGADSRMVLNV